MGEKRSENLQINPHIPLCSLDLKCMVFSKLRYVIHFRTPWKQQEIGKEVSLAQTG